VAYERLKKGEDKLLGENANLVPFYMKQTNVLDNACGIIACLHSVMNQDAVALEPDSVLANFKANTAS
jgi:hypothetical protein